MKESPSLDLFKKVVSQILGSVNQHFKDLRFCSRFFSHLLISSSSLNCDKRVFDKHIGDELVLVQSKCLVEGAVNKILNWLVFAICVDNEYLIWDGPGQSFHERHKWVSVLICHARFPPVLNHTNTVDSALTQNALSNLIGLCFVKLNPSCVAEAGRVYESESCVPELNFILYGITCFWFHFPSNLVFFSFVV